MPKFKIKHTTKYTYKTPVRDSANQIVLFPVNDEYQEVLKHDLRISGDAPVEVYKDYYGNEVGTFTHCEPHSELLIVSKLQVVTTPRPLPLDDIFANQQWEVLDRIKHNIPYVDYLKQEHFEGLDELKAILTQGDIREETPFDVAKRFNKYVFENFKYIPGITTVETTLDQIWKLRAGVCQDFAHILLVMLRLRHIPARYVSGYICPHKNGMRGEGATHAWAEAYIPNYGWLGFDPTNNCVANETHVRLAVGRNFPDCTPVKGVYKGGAEHKLEVRVTVSYGNEEEEKEKEPEATPIVSSTGTFPVNSFQQHLELMQQQQQQQ